MTHKKKERIDMNDKIVDYNSNVIYPDPPYDEVAKENESLKKQIAQLQKELEDVTTDRMELQQENGTLVRLLERDRLNLVAAQNGLEAKDKEIAELELWASLASEYNPDLDSIIQKGIKRMKDIRDKIKRSHD